VQKQEIINPNNDAEMKAIMLGLLHLVSEQQTIINNLPHLIKEGIKQGLKDLLTPTKTTEKLSKKQQQDLDVKNLRTKRHLEAITKLGLNHNKANN
jgi:hypothetical protein